MENKKLRAMKNSGCMCALHTGAPFTHPAPARGKPRNHTQGLHGCKHALWITVGGRTWHQWEALRMRSLQNAHARCSWLLRVTTVLVGGWTFQEGTRNAPRAGTPRPPATVFLGHGPSPVFPVSWKGLGP